MVMTPGPGVASATTVTPGSTATLQTRPWPANHVSVQPPTSQARTGTSTITLVAATSPTPPSKQVGRWPGVRPARVLGGVGATPAPRVATSATAVAATPPEHEPVVLTYRNGALRPQAAARPFAWPRTPAGGVAA